MKRIGLSGDSLLGGDFVWLVFKSLIVAVIGITAFEYAIHWILSGITVLQSHSTGIIIGISFICYVVYKEQKSQRRLVSKRKQAEEALSESDQKYQELADSISDVFFAIKKNGDDFIYTFWNRASEILTGVKAEIAIGRSFKEIFPEDNESRRQINDLFSRVVETKKSEQLVVIYPGAGNEYIVHEINIYPTEEGASVFVKDVTRRKLMENKIKASLLEKEIMLKEIHHRVRNNLQVISSLLDLQSSRSQDKQAKAALDESKARVRTMAIIHTQLYQSDDLANLDFGDLVRDLTRNISQAYGRTESHVEINVEADEIHLSLGTSIPCGLILNELISNSLKYAFPEGRLGEINIKLRSENDQVVMTVRDNGVGFPSAVDFKKVKSLGLELVNLLVMQLGGQIDKQINDGTQWTITFPIKEERE